MYVFTVFAKKENRVVQTKTKTLINSARKPLHYFVYCNDHSKADYNFSRLRITTLLQLKIYSVNHGDWLLISILSLRQ
jgi:hypothetical protein